MLVRISVDILISSRTDYVPHSPQAMFAAIKSGKFEFISPFWDDVDAGAKDMINCLLVLDTEKRYSAEQVTTKRPAKDCLCTSRIGHKSVSVADKKKQERKDSFLPFLPCVHKCCVCFEASKY